MSEDDQKRGPGRPRKIQEANEVIIRLTGDSAWGQVKALNALTHDDPEQWVKLIHKAINDHVNAQGLSEMLKRPDPQG